VGAAGGGEVGPAPPPARAPAAGAARPRGRGRRAAGLCEPRTQQMRRAQAALPQPLLGHACPLRGRPRPGLCPRRAARRAGGGACPRGRARRAGAVAAPAGRQHGSSGLRVAVQPHQPGGFKQHVCHGLRGAGAQGGRGAEVKRGARAAGGAAVWPAIPLHAARARAQGRRRALAADVRGQSLTESPRVRCWPAEGRGRAGLCSWRGAQQLSARARGEEACSAVRWAPPLPAYPATRRTAAGVAGSPFCIE
jgi:hypothetical protein